MASSQKALMLELKSLQEEPVEGSRITLVDESDLYNWEGDLQMLLLNGREPLHDWAGNEYKCKSQTNSKIEE
ncbi:Ubiquitin-conjugating enzyme E2 R2 [Myotis brandtii]|uniref:Ubiquitin-conjugating enzyme E2 R2 n=1 Tax=Myotis brandtii TaxID=109478 RepID=S7NZ31_MYOBR|nr:Ubiquitin-conjugating enzyme E2 R2 [Myotis brandtii]